MSTPVPPVPPAPVPPAPQKKNNRKMIVASAIGVIVVLLVGIGIGTAASSDSTAAPSPHITSKTGISPTSAPTYTAPSPTYTAPTTTSPPPPAKPEGKYGVASCDTASNYKDLVGSTRVENTGDVEFTAEVTFTWQNGDGSKVNASPKKVTLHPGQSKLVFFTIAVGLNGQLNFQGNPDYFHGNKACSSKVTIKG